MRVLVAIANHGTKNIHFLQALLREYRNMPYDVDIVVLSNIPKDLGDGIEVIIGCPSKDPWSLPFGHKKIFAERCDQYDLFIYSEDDTLINENNIKAFLEVTQLLPQSMIAGFIRYEKDSLGNIYYSTVHSHFHWVPNSVIGIGDETFARFTNDHSACYLLTRDQLKRAMASGGFLVEPHQEKYDLLVAAATDPYTQCGMTKVICISRLDEFSLHHMPNQYLGNMGLHSFDLELQLRALFSIAKNDGAPEQLLQTETRIRQNKWSKSYYEPCRSDLLESIADKNQTILSVGCGWGATESALVDRGCRVVGVPLDPVIAACANARGVEITSADFDIALRELDGELFDCIIFSDILQYLPEPVEPLLRFSSLLSPKGRVIIRIPNMNRLRMIRYESRGDIRSEDMQNFARTGLHFTTLGTVNKWLKASGLKTTIVKYCDMPSNHASKLILAIARRLVAGSLIITAKRRVQND